MSTYQGNLWIVNGLNNTTINGITPTENTDYIIDVLSSEARWNETKVLDMNWKVANCPDYSLYAFGRNTRSGFANQLLGRIYYLKIYEEGRIIRDYIPCYCTTTVINVDGVQVPENTKGLYDLVEGKFYTNKGTGSFGYGMDDGTYVAPQ